MHKELEKIVLTRGNWTTIMYLFREPNDGDRFFGAYRRKLKSADDIGSASATGLSPDDVVTLRKLYDQP